MKLLLKLNLVLVLVMTLALALVGYFSWRLLVDNARNEVIQNAKVMMEAAYSMRTYTIDQVRPLLKKLPEAKKGKKFFPQTVPAYAATETFATLRKKFPEYSYKEAALNPTNPRNRATDWENDLITQFRDHPDKSEIIGDRETPTGRSLFLSHPIKIGNPACLSCHSEPKKAPRAMRKIYGTNNGFGWKQDETIGAQVVSVPMSAALDKAEDVWRTFMIAMAGIFLLVLILLNILISAMVIRPVKRMAIFADEVSRGELDTPELEVRGRDEIATLGESFNRMARSVKEALKMLDD